MDYYDLRDKEDLIAFGTECMAVIAKGPQRKRNAGEKAKELEIKVLRNSISAKEIYDMFDKDDTLWILGYYTELSTKARNTFKTIRTAKEEAALPYFSK